MKGRGAPPRWLLTLLFVALLGSGVTLFLVSPSARVAIPIPLVAKPQRGPLLPVPLDGLENARGTSVYRLALSGTDPQALAAHDELWLFLAGADGRVLGAALHVRGTPCVFDSARRVKLGEGMPLALRRSGACLSLVAQPGVALDLTVEMEGAGELALWAHRPPPEGAEPGLVEVSPTGPRGSGTPLRVRGFLVDYPPRAPRIELLNYMWQVSPGVRWLWLALVVAAVLAFGGGLVFPVRPAPVEGQRKRVATTLRGGVGAFCLASALGLSYAVLVPPLAGPDEPYHLLGFADLTGGAGLAEQIEPWIRHTHLARIRFHPGERFRTVDVGNPHPPQDDPDLRATEVAMRSPSTAAVWKVLGPLLNGRRAPQVLLGIRIVNALLFGLAVGTATVLAMTCTAVPYPQLLCFPFLFVPTLPFFATHVSETAVLCATYIVFASSLGVLFLDGPRAHRAGVPLGLSGAFMLAGGRSGWPPAVIILAAAMTRMILGTRGARGRVRAALVFWSGLAVGVGVFHLLVDQAFLAGLELNRPYAPGGLATVVIWLVQRPWAVYGLITLGAFLEVTLHSSDFEYAKAWEVPATRAVGWVTRGLAAAVMFSIVGSLFLNYPHLRPLDSLPLRSTPEYVLQAVLTMATAFRITQTDFLLSAAFWGGFGWIDTIPPEGFVATLVLLTGLALTMLLVEIGRTGDGRRTLWLLALAFGWVGALVVHAIAADKARINLNGRYLIGWYLSVLVVAWSWPTLGRPVQGAAAAVAGSPPLASRVILSLILCGLVHSYSLCFILWRYF